MLCTGTQTDEENLPQISVRNIKRNIKPEILETLVNLQAKHHVPGKQCAPIIAEVANNVFNQNWHCAKSQTEDNNNSDNNYNTILPSRKAISTYVEDFTLLSLKNIGQKVLRNKADGGINTLHFDDTVKKSGVKLFDV